MASTVLHPFYSRGSRGSGRWSDLHYVAQRESAWDPGCSHSCHTTLSCPETPAWGPQYALRYWALWLPWYLGLGSLGLLGMAWAEQGLSALRNIWPKPATRDLRHVPSPQLHPRARGLCAAEERNVLGSQGASTTLGWEGDARGQVRWGPDSRGNSEPLATSGPF